MSKRRNVGDIVQLDDHDGSAPYLGCIDAQGAERGDLCPLSVSDPNHDQQCAEWPVVYNEGYWEARCQHAVLLKPDGDVGFINLSALLSILAGVGIRCSKIEWDGLPVFSYEPQKPDEASIAHEEMMLQVLAQINDAERDS